MVRMRTGLKRKVLLAISGTIGCVLIVAVVYTILPLRENIRTALTTMQARLSAPATAPFPAVDTNRLSKTQIAIIDLERQEYAKHPISYDQNVLTYTQGDKQAWCADFISWVMLKVGVPFSNPNSGSWRIPGVYTLQEYYQSIRRYETVGSYTPQPGDVAFYIGKSAFGLNTSGHVALVIEADHGHMTTIGGNEGGRLRIDTQAIQPGVNRLVGFGRLD